MTFKDLLIAILIEYRTRWGRPPNKTRLLKLAYLVDVFHARRFGRPLLDEPWVYYLYGPYRFDYDETISAPPFEVEEKDYEGDKTATSVTIGREAATPAVEIEVKGLIAQAVHEFGTLALNELLDYVYFETEPMMAAERRKERLDFSTVQPDSYYKTLELVIDSKAEERLRKEFRAKVKKLRK